MVKSKNLSVKKSLSQKLVQKVASRRVHIEYILILRNMKDRIINEDYLFANMFVVKSDKGQRIYL